MNMLEAEKLIFSASGRNIIEDLSLQVPAGDVLAIIGPNGAGKSTLLKMLTGQLTPSAGAVRLQGEAVNSLAPSAMAKVLAYVPQGPQAPPDILVRELVSYGRHPHRAWYMGSRAEDEEAVERALERTGLWTWLSGRSGFYPAARGSGLGWRWRWRSSRRCFCWMSRLPFWMCAISLSCWIFCSA